MTQIPKVHLRIFRSTWCLGQNYHLTVPAESINEEKILIIREALSILIKCNTAETPKIENMINFHSTFRLFFSHHQERKCILTMFIHIRLCRPNLNVVFLVGSLALMHAIEILSGLPAGIAPTPCDTHVMP